MDAANSMLSEQIRPTNIPYKVVLRTSLMRLLNIESPHKLGHNSFLSVSAVTLAAALPVV